MIPMIMFQMIENPQHTIYRIKNHFEFIFFKANRSRTRNSICTKTTNKDRRSTIEAHRSRECKQMFQNIC